MGILIFLIIKLFNKMSKSGFKNFVAGLIKPDVPSKKKKDKSPLNVEKPERKESAPSRKDSSNSAKKDGDRDLLSLLTHGLSIKELEPTKK